MKKISVAAILLAILSAFVSCNQNEPTSSDDATKNQPANPSTWSPAGHMYVYSYGDGTFCVAAFGTDSVFGYNTDMADYSFHDTIPFNTNSETYKYTMHYPYYTAHSDQSGYTVTYMFEDTLTIIAHGWTYKLVN